MTEQTPEKPAEPSAVKTGLTYAEKRFGRLCVVALILLFSLFQLVEINSAVITQGLVTVEGKPRPVQSVEGGQVQTILVSEGDVVRAGQVVVELDPTLTEINRDILRTRLAELLARETRLEAERQQSAIFPPLKVEADLDAEIMRAQLDGQYDVFKSRRAVLDSQKAQLAERKAQHQAQIAGLQAQIAASESQLEFVTQEVDNLQSLLTQGLVQESRVRDLQSRQAGLLGEVAVHRTEISRMRNAIRDTDLEMTRTDRAFQERAVSELREVSAEIRETRLELARSDEFLEQLLVRAPVSGVVHEMQPWAIGGVVPPLETLMTVVPNAEGLEFEVQVAPEAIDTVYVGQIARIRFPAFDQRSTPELTGTIAAIAPDRVTDPATGRAFYRVDLMVPDAELARLGSNELIPGMPVEAFLQTGRRTITNFLLKPVLDQFTYAFREA